jgi:hypothetical protein
VFHIKVVARPDARMVEVPLEIEVELPREFDGVALLAASGLPRKVKLKAPTDTVKLSTAYRADRLLADVVRFALRGTLQDVARVQDAARAFIKGVRERRRDGATLLVEVSDRGKIDVTELGQPQEVPSGPSARPPPEAGGPASLAADRVDGLERRLSRIEAALAKLLGNEKTAARADIEARLARLEEQLGVQGLDAAARQPAAEAAERTLSAEPRGRTAPRRATAIDSFAEGLRAELRGRATQLLGTSDRAVLACDQAARLAADAEQHLGAPAGGEEDRELRRLAAEAATRQTSLQLFLAEVDLYAAAELAIADRLLERLGANPPAPGQLSPDPAGPLSALGESLLRKGPFAELLGAWVQSAAPLCGWTLIEARRGDEVRPDLHEVESDGGRRGAPIGRVLVPGVRRRDGSILARARVALEDAGVAPEVTGLRAELPVPAAFVVSDSEVEEMHDLPGSADKPLAPAPAAAAGVGEASPASGAAPSVSTNPIVATIKAALAAEAESEGSARTGAASESPATPADDPPERPRGEEP